MSASKLRKDIVVLQLLAMTLPGINDDDVRCEETLIFLCVKNSFVAQNIRASS